MEDITIAIGAILVVYYALLMAGSSELPEVVLSYGFVVGQLLVSIALLVIGFELRSHSGRPKE